MPTQLSYEDEELGDRHINIGVQVHSHTFEDDGVIYHVDIADEALGTDATHTRSVVVCHPPLRRMIVSGTIEVEITENDLQLITLEPNSHLIVYCLDGDIRRSSASKAFTLVNTDTLLT